MAEHVVIARLPKPKGRRAEPAGKGVGWWWMEAGWPEGAWDLCIRGPDGRACRLVTAKHAITAEGVVTPSIQMPYPNGWHVMGTLAGWTAEDAAKART